MTGKLLADSPLTRSFIGAVIALIFSSCATRDSSFEYVPIATLEEIATQPEPRPPQCVEVLDGCVFQRPSGSNPSSDAIMAWESQCRARSCEVQRMVWKARRDRAVAEIERRARASRPMPEGCSETGTRIEEGGVIGSDCKSVRPPTGGQF